jgi:hypothetical protein
MFHLNVQISKPTHDNNFMSSTHQCFATLKCIKLVQVCVQGKYLCLIQLNCCHITHEYILQLLELGEIVDKFKQGKCGNKPQHDLHMTKEVEVHLCFFITRVVDGHLINNIMYCAITCLERDNIY